MYVLRIGKSYVSSFWMVKRPENSCDNIITWSSEIPKIRTLPIPKKAVTSPWGSYNSVEEAQHRAHSKW